MNPTAMTKTGWNYQHRKMISLSKMGLSKISQVWLATMTFLRTYVVCLNLVWSFKRRIIIINNLRTLESRRYFSNVLSILYKIQIIISVWLLLIATFSVIVQDHWASLVVVEHLTIPLTWALPLFITHQVTLAAQIGNIKKSFKFYKIYRKKTKSLT